MKVAVFGLGYAGTVRPRASTKGAHDVWGVDVDAEKVAAGRARVSARWSSRASTSSCGARSPRGGCTRPPRARSRSTAPRWCSSASAPLRPERRASTSRRSIGPWRRSRALPPVAIHRRPAIESVVLIRSTVPPGTVDDIRRARLLALDCAAPGRARRTQCARSSSARGRASPTSSIHPSWSSAPRPRGRHCGRRAVRFRRPSEAAIVDDTNRGSTQVRLQRVPRDEGVLHERAGPTLARHSMSTPGP